MTMEDPDSSIGRGQSSSASAATPVRLAVLVTAAGKSERFGGDKKEVFHLEGRTVLHRAVSAFSRLPGLYALAITVPAGSEATMRAAIPADTTAELEQRLGGRFLVVVGGPTRRDSVRLGLEALAAASAGPSLDDLVVLVHDGARPWVSPALAERVAAIAARSGACVPVIRLVETPKAIGEDGIVAGHPSRATLATAQTPQGFRLAPLLLAHRRAHADGVACTDDAELWDRYVGPVAWTEGEQGNRKITYRKDLLFRPEELPHDDGPGPQGRAGPSAETEDGRAASRAPRPPFRVGEGWDIHRLVAGRRLMVGGVEIPFDRGEDGHSDGDVLLHAVIDALLGAAALGDIGSHFPPSDERWRGADSADLARRALQLVRETGWAPGNLDCTVVVERPMLGPHRDAIRESLSRIVDLPLDAVSLKAKTKEGVDATGEGRAIEARAVVLVVPAPR